MPVRHGNSLLTSNSAKFFVVDQFMNGAMFAANRAIRILAQAQFAEAHGQRIEQQQRPTSGSPMPRISLMVSMAWIEPTMPGSTPNTPPSAHEGTRPGGGGSG